VKAKFSILGGIAVSVEGKMIVLGVSGGIAAYKAATICSQLKQKGADVRVIMTKSATQFVQPLTFQTLSRHYVYTDTFDEADPAVVSHIDLADNADLFLVSPATANIIGKLANGLADDMLSTTLLATEAPVWMAPAMNGHMLEHPAVQENMRKLVERGVRMVSPGEGLLACGYVGKGRLAEPEQIIAEVENYFRYPSRVQSKITPATSSIQDSWWKGKKILVTAGPTREEIDPVRYLSNYSSGKMGYAMAEMAVALGAKVTLVTGPVSLPSPEQVELISVSTSEEMYQAVLDKYDDMDVVIKAAAVADYQPTQVIEQKIKKTGDSLVLTLKKTKDILQALGQQKKKQILVGFAAETNNVEEYALKKIEKKNLDFVVANNVTLEGAGFGTDTNVVTIYHSSGKKVELPLLNKKEVALQVLRTVADVYV
jgi:phosphopantothenoylcysteine decarboxylase/phosphopantothenate--cysteine ligase